MTLKIGALYQAQLRIDIWNTGKKPRYEGILYSYDYFVVLDFTKESIRNDKYMYYTIYTSKGIVRTRSYLNGDVLGVRQCCK